MLERFSASAVPMIFLSLAEIGRYRGSELADYIIDIWLRNPIEFDGVGWRSKSNPVVLLPPTGWRG